jgi:hypothetical protein
MDRTSSSHNLRTTDTSQVNPSNTDQTQSKKPSGIVSFEKQKQFTLPKTAFNNPQQAAKTYVNINRAMLSDPQTLYKDGKFSEVRAETEDVYKALLNFERSVFKYHDKYDSTQNDPTAREDWKEFKSEKNALFEKNEAINDEKNLQASTGYKTLSGERKPSNLERLLAGSPLSTNLDPLTGVFRDSKTGLYAELKPLGSTPGKYALCFGSTGVGRMTMKQIKVDIAQVLNKTKVPAAYEQAAKLAAELRKETGAEITVTGQSMGGGLANYVGMKLGIESVCYNPAALGQAAIKDLEKNRCITVENLNIQKIIRQKGDIVSGEKNQKKIARLANFFTSEKVGIPQHLGPTFIANKNDNPLLNGVTRGYQSRHFTSSFQPFYDYSNTQTVQPDTASEKSTISSESSSASSPSGGEKSTSSLVN